MTVSITTRGYIEVYRDGDLVSRHTVETKAIESALAHALEAGDGTYTLKFPDKDLVSALRKTQLPIRWSPVTVSLTAGTATSVNVAQYLQNPRGLAITYTTVGALPTGATLSSAGILTFNGAVNATTASVQFVATAGDVVAESAATAVTVAPPPVVNTAPVFSVAPTTASLGSSGGTIQFVAVDPQGDAVVYSLASRYLSSITINSSTGLVTVPSSAAGTNGNITVRASDGTLTADATCAVTVAATGGWNPTYPRIAANVIGTYNWNSALITQICRFQFALLPHYPTASYTNYSNLPALVSAIRAVSTSVKLVVYTIFTEVSVDAVWAPFHNKLAAEKGTGGVGDWYLRNAAGANVSTYPNTWKTNCTRLVTPDSNGLYWPQWVARWYNTNWGSIAIDGVLQDVLYYDGDAFSVTADWNEDGVNDADTSPLVENALIQGQLDYATEWKALRPAYWNMANYLDTVKYAIPSSWQQQWHGGYQEAAIGETWSVEQWGTWQTVMDQYRVGMSISLAPQIVMFCVTPTTFVAAGMTTYRAMRYGLCSCLMDNGWFVYNANLDYMTAPWFDEYDWNLGYPTQTPRTSAYSNGVYLREFDNGCAIVNPKGNGAKTITLPSAGTGKRWDRLTGTQDAAVNNGATNVTSVTINERDGLILKRVSA